MRSDTRMPSGVAAWELTVPKDLVAVGEPLKLIVNDQERYNDRLPPNYRLPGKERLLELGTEFTNQQIASCVCTSSRSNIYTGQHIQQTKMFDNLNFPWVEDLATDLPNIGHMMRRLGYYSAGTVNLASVKRDLGRIDGRCLRRSGARHLRPNKEGSGP